VSFSLLLLAWARSLYFHSRALFFSTPLLLLLPDAFTVVVVEGDDARDLRADSASSFLLQEVLSLESPFFVYSTTTIARSVEEREKE